MKVYTYKEKTVDLAIKKGLKELGLEESQVKIEVEEAGSNGILGLFKKEAIVKLTPLDIEYKENQELNKEDNKDILIEEKESKENIKNDLVENNISTPTTEEKIFSKKEKEDEIINNKEKIVDYMTKIVHSMGFDTANLKFIDEGNKNYTIKILGVENTSLLIGKRGNTLNSLQVLANNYGKKFSKKYFRINIDCDEYRDSRKETLEELALNMAKKSKKLGKPIELEPMTSFERKIIHNALSNIQNVETESKGKEPYRYLVITAK
ncbi:protein jag [Gemella sp. GH3]|uniref:RNA-binding cell elongation regulator Jag/EloR n=1 Tax=unclassified Gemella TaxID=2624949 RepID=UPI0015D07C64|nr:protein jag [Gemella sp. GH3.1]NYS50789.1 protein jag [Gemella sp. GH3]